MTFEKNKKYLKEVLINRNLKVSDRKMDVILYNPYISEMTQQNTHELKPLVEGSTVKREDMGMAISLVLTEMGWIRYGSSKEYKELWEKKMLKYLINKDKKW